MNHHLPFFQDKNCPWFPCHKTNNAENFNCFLCYCPLYALGDNCGGNFCYTEQGIKDCSHCLIPHTPGQFDKITAKLGDVIKLAKKTPATDKPEDK